MTSTESRQHRSTVAMAAICTLAISLGGGWTAAHVKLAVTESKVTDLRDRQDKSEDRIEENRNSMTRLDATLNYIVQALNEANQRLRRIEAGRNGEHN